MVCSFNSVVVFMMFLVGVLWWFVFVFSGCCGYLWFVFVCLLLVVYGASWVWWASLVVAGMLVFWVFYSLLVLVLMFCRCC